MILFCVPLSSSCCHNLIFQPNQGLETQSSLPYSGKGALGPAVKPAGLVQAAAFTRGYTAGAKLPADGLRPGGTANGAMSNLPLGPGGEPPGGHGREPAPAGTEGAHQLGRQRGEGLLPSAGTQT